jgi:hypothetical protein
LMLKDIELSGDTIEVFENVRKRGGDGIRTESCESFARLSAKSVTKFSFCSGMRQGGAK